MPSAQEDPPIPPTHRRRPWLFKPPCAIEPIAKVGEGTYGQVWKAKDTNNDQNVALKIMKINDASSSYDAGVRHFHPNLKKNSDRSVFKPTNDMREHPNFESPQISVSSIREIKVLKRLRHENIVNLIEVRLLEPKPTDYTPATPSNSKIETILVPPKNGAYQISLEYMDHDLSGILHSDIQFTEAQIKSLMHQLLTGIAYCHGNCIMHRDLKPANILMDDCGNLKIADFGLAQLCIQDRRNTLEVITIHYRPPEIFLGNRTYGFPADMWSVGCIMAEFFTRSPLLPGVNGLDQLEKIFRLCGTPTLKTWPSWQKLPGAGTAIALPKFRPGLEKRFRSMAGKNSKICSNAAFDLFQNLLRLNPSDRFTAAQALAHPWFHVPPSAASKADLPVFELESHEMALRKPKS